jgi:peptidoglycan hydrolase-like protein with peptidoglycan-binding domain
VKALQEFLNAHGYPVASVGAGSPGNETTRFGAATKAALIKYQKEKGITPASGYFGAKTRAAVNAE